MNIQTKLILMIASMLLITFSILGYFHYQQSIKNAEQDLYDQADKVRAVLMAYRTTGQNVFIEHKIEITEKTLGLLPAYALGQMSKIYSKWDSSGFSFNNVSDIPRNPEHQADSLELEIMDYFRQDNADDTVFRPFTQNNRRFYIYARPIWVKKPCLKCHSTPENAPKTIRDKYTAAYNYNVGDLRGILSIKMPATEIENKAKDMFLHSFQILFIAMIVIFLMVMFIIKNSVIQPLSSLSKAMKDVSNGDLSQRITGLSGEFSNMQDSFNLMGAELENNQKQLEDRVKRRTQDLSKSNTELTSTLDSLNKTQAQLIEREKMAALGGLVAGVAHEINTPIGVSVTAISHLENETKQFKNKFISTGLKKKDLEIYLEDSDEASKIIINNLNRAAELIRSFKLIAVDQSHNDKRLFNVKNYVDEVLRSLKPAFKNIKHQIIFNCSDTLSINFYPGQFSQIITNLLMNSIKHAYSKGEEACLTLDIYNEKNKIYLHYSDDGKGISKENLKEIFTPFYTTARHDGGSGLGLSTIYNIVTHNMKGSIRCESIEGEGAHFFIEFYDKPQ